MRKKLLLGSLLVLILLLFIPSISAIKNKMVEEKISDKLIIEQIIDLDLKNIKEIYDFSQIKYPIFYSLIISSLAFRWYRIEILAVYSFDEDFPYIEIKHPVLFLRFLILIISTNFLSGFWEIISHELGWNWTIPF